MDYLIVGLGNKGERYARTRHNAGWIILDEILGSRDWHDHKYARAMYHNDIVDGFSLRYLKPLTMMNESGFSVRYLRDEYGIAHDHIIVIYDDIDLPLGKVKISHNRGSGGHNGIRSLEHHLGSANFIRIRIGISSEIGEGKVVKPHVLGDFTVDDMDRLKKIAVKVTEALQLIIVHGLSVAMNKINEK